MTQTISVDVSGELVWYSYALLYYSDGLTVVS